MSIPMDTTSHNEFVDGTGNTQHRILVARQQSLSSLQESNVSVVTRATRVCAVKEFETYSKLSCKLNGVWLDANSPNAVGVPADGVSRPHHEQTRRRMTFADQCASLYTVSNYGDFMLLLAQLVPILDRMRVAGFIHGDISPLNCLVDTHDRHIKISDIEHACQYESQNEGSAPSIGVPHFMAVEYQRGTFFFGHKGGFQYGRRFPFHFLHDLESVAWMYAWLLLNTHPDCIRAHNTHEMRHSILMCRNNLFDESFEGSFFRVTYMKHSGSVYTIHPAVTRALEPLYEQANALPLLEGFASFDHLATCYMELKSTGPLGSDKGTPPRWAPANFKASHYSKLHDIFMSVHDAVKNVNYEAISFAKFQQRAAAVLAPPLPAAKQESDETHTPSRKSGAGTGTRPGKRRAEDELENDGVKKPKRTQAAKPKGTAGRKKQAASSSRQPAATTGPSRRARASRPVGHTDRVLRSQTAKKNKK